MSLATIIQLAVIIPAAKSCSVLNFCDNWIRGRFSDYFEAGQEFLIALLSILSSRWQDEKNAYAMKNGTYRNATLIFDFLRY